MPTYCAGSGARCMGGSFTGASTTRAGWRPTPTQAGFLGLLREVGRSLAD